MDRREFSQWLPALLAATALAPEAMGQQQGTMEHPVMGEPTQGPAGGKMAGPLPMIASGVYEPGPAYGSQPKRKSRRFLVGMLKAGNIQMEIHETTQEPGAAHEPSDKHLHSELWLVREGVCELTINGVTRTMRAGDVGLVNAGDYHYIRNSGDGPCTYFVVTMGPPEQAA